MRSRVSVCWVLVALFALSAFVSAQAMTDEEFRAYVDSINKAAAEREQTQSTARPQVAPPPVASPAPTPQPTAVQTTTALSLGSRGQAVVELQQKLIALGHLAAGNDTGYFGLLTRAAIRTFQCKRNIICSGDESSTGYGLAGPRTRLMLDAKDGIARSANGAPATTPQSPNQSLIDALLAQVKNLQGKVASLLAGGGSTSASTQTFAGGVGNGGGGGGGVGETATQSAVSSNQTSAPAPTLTSNDGSLDTNQTTQNTGVPDQQDSLVLSTITSTAGSSDYTPRVSIPVAASNEHREYTWGESYILQSLALDAERTGDTTYLMEARDRIRKVIAGRDDSRRVYGSRPVWSFIDLTSASCPVGDAGTDGMILKGITYYLRYLYNHGMTNDPRWQYDAIKDAVIETLRAHQQDWNTSGGYHAPASTQSCYRDTAGVSMYTRGIEPFNLDAAIGTAHAHIYAITGNVEDRDKAVAIASRIQKYQKVLDDGSLVWPYWSAESSIDDTGHAFLVAEFMQQALQSGVAFSFADLSRFAVTINSRIFAGNSFAVAIDGGGVGDQKYAGSYFPLSQLNGALSRVRTLYAKISLNASTSGFQHLLRALSLSTDARTYGATCTLDNQCATGSCFANKVCGTPLGNGSTCYKHSDCYSGWCSKTAGVSTGACSARSFATTMLPLSSTSVLEHQTAANLPYGASCTADVQCASNICFAGKVCGNLLGNGSTCTRDLECSSNLCQSGVCSTSSITNLPYGSSCTADSQCSSNICYAGKVCGNLLGSGSTCTRNLECVSNECIANVCTAD